MRLLFLFCLLASGCPESSSSPTLWLAQDGSEAMVKLVDREPDPF